MNNTPISTRLATLEDQLAQVSAQLLQPPSAELTQACSLLQAAVIEFAQLMRQSPAAVTAQAPLQVRLRRVAAQLAVCREALVRRTVFTQQAFAALVPTARSHTYGPATGSARNPYASAGRQSGEFRMASA